MPSIKRFLLLSGLFAAVFLCFRTRTDYTFQDRLKTPAGDVLVVDGPHGRMEVRVLREDQFSAKLQAQKGRRGAGLIGFKVDTLQENGRSIYIYKSMEGIAD